MTREEHIALFKEYTSKSKEELDAIINTGMFNTVIEGYLSLTLKGMGVDPEEVRKARVELKAVLDEVTATEARQAGEKY